MGHSRQTPRLNLPLYNDDDKPTFLGDVNTTNTVIDEQFSSLKDTVTSHSGKLDRFEDGSAILTALKMVDGPTSGLDADTVDGKHSNEFAPVSALDTLGAQISNLSSAMAGLDSQLTTIKGQITAAQNAVTALSTRPLGRMVKTNGEQGIVDGQAVIMSADIGINGVAFDTANGGGLRVAVAGKYQLNMNAFTTGNGGYTRVEVKRWRGGASNTVAFCTISSPNSEEYTGARSEIIDVLAGDIFTLFATANAGINIWGDATKNGTTVSLAKLD